MPKMGLQNLYLTNSVLTILTYNGVHGMICWGVGGVVDERGPKMNV